VDGDGDEEGGGGEEGGDREPFFFLTFGVGGRSGARGSEGGCGGRLHEEKNSLLLFGRKSERDRVERIFDREKRDIMNLWKKFLEKIDCGQANRVLHWWKHLW
jgi:hypothetical protein